MRNIEHVYANVLLSTKNREQQKALVKKYLGWVSRQTKLKTSCCCDLPNISDLLNIGRANSEKNITSPRTNAVQSNSLFLICMSNFTAHRILYEDRIIIFCYILSILLLNKVQLALSPSLQRWRKLSSWCILRNVCSWLERWAQVVHAYGKQFISRRW